MGRILTPQRSLLTLFRQKGGDFFGDYVGSGGAYTVAVWNSDDLVASPKSTTWIDRKNGHVMTFYNGLEPPEPDLTWIITQEDANVNGHPSVLFEAGTYYGGQGINDTAVLQMDGVDDLHDGYSVYFVAKKTRHLGNRNLYRSANDANYELAVRATNPNYLSVVQGASGFGNFVPDVAVNQWAVFSIRAKEGSNTTKLRLNLEAQTLGTLSTTYGTSILGASLNGDSSRVAYTQLGSAFTFVLLRQGQDTDADATEIITKLMEMYGIT